MRLRIRHLTEYTYPQAQKMAMQVLRLQPNNSEQQTVLSWYVDSPQACKAEADAFGNTVHRLYLENTEAYFKIEARGVVDTRNGPWQQNTGLSPLVFLRASTSTQMDQNLWQLLEPYAAMLQSNLESGVQALSAEILFRVPFTLGVSHAHTSASQALANAGGVCQDHAHILIACCRAMGVPARYVSGYLYSPEHTPPQEAGHAWAQVWHPEKGWLGVDVTNQCLVNDCYVQLAIGLDYYDACPIRGVRIGKGDETMSVKVWVEAL